MFVSNLLYLPGSPTELWVFSQVIKESAELALSWVKTHSYDLGITNKRAQDPLRIPDAMIDVHLHLPAGAQKKDGPSAGVAMVRTDLFSPLMWGF